MPTKVFPVILSGGSGSRLWPLSREQYPKQFLPLAGAKTMLQKAILRVKSLDDFESPIIVCNAEHRFLVAQQCRQINVKDPTILVEPVGRNTAPAITAAALQALKETDGGILLVLTADHIIEDIEAFHKSIIIACEHAKAGKLVTFGIVPTYACTDYGYIKASKENATGGYTVEDFVEKPSLETAEYYLKQGNYLWNSGMFILNVDTLIDEITTYAPDIFASVNDAVNNAVRDSGFICLDKSAFASSRTDSIDYAIMEKSDKIVVVPLDAKWSDIGSWSALYDIGIKDSNDNVILGDVFAEETTNSYINANNHLVVTLGIENLVIVKTSDATLIAAKNRASEIKNIVEKLKKQDREEHICHRKVYRPWGWYDRIEMGIDFQVKRLHVYPKAKLSLQMHHKRAEHWVVVRGTATVVNGAETLTLKKGQATFIPLETKHSLENQGDEPLEIVEVQNGTYLGEDDIVRFEDLYGRT